VFVVLCMRVCFVVLSEVSYCLVFLMFSLKKKDLKVGKNIVPKDWCLLWSFVQSAEHAWLPVEKRTETKSQFRLCAQNVDTRKQLKRAQKLLPNP